jgi:hypothetical protein
MSQPLSLGLGYSVFFRILAVHVLDHQWYRVTPPPPPPFRRGELHWQFCLRQGLSLLRKPHHPSSWAIPPAAEHLRISSHAICTCFECSLVVSNKAVLFDLLFFLAKDLILDGQAHFHYQWALLPASGPSRARRLLPATVAPSQVTMLRTRWDTLQYCIYVVILQAFFGPMIDFDIVLQRFSVPPRNQFTP